MKGELGRCHGRTVLVAGLFVCVTATLAWSCGAPSPGEGCDGYYSPAQERCFPVAADTGRACRDSDECEYGCDCPANESNPVGECREFPYDQYCLLVDGERELLVY